MELDPKELAAETKTVATEAANAAIETKTVEFDSKLEAKSAEFDTKIEGMESKNTEQLELLQKSFDDLSAEVKDFGAQTKAPEVKNELKSWLDEKAGLMLENKNANFTLELKNESTYTPSAGAVSAPYRDDRQSMIEFDPHQMTLAKYITGKTGSGGAYRFSQRASVTDNSDGKAKGAAFGRTSLGVNDVHTPYITVGHILTVPKEELNDTTALESYFREDMSGYLTDTINNQILVGDGGADDVRGIRNWVTARTEAQFDTFFAGLANTYTGANEIDVLNASSLSLEGLNFMGMKKAFVHPSTIARIQGQKATDGHYILNTAVDPTGKVRSFIGNIEVVSNSAVTAGEYFMFDPSALKWITREGMKVEMGYTGDDWERNNVSLKVYGRYALVASFLYGAGIVNGTFANAISSLNS